VLYIVHFTAFCLGGPFFSGHGVDKNYIGQAVAARWAATAWFSCRFWAAASPLRSATYIIEHAGANQIATRLRRHCSGPRCCSQPASQPASIWPTAYGTTDRPEVTAAAYLHAFSEKCHYFRNDDPYTHKTQHMSCI